MPSQPIWWPMRRYRSAGAKLVLDALASGTADARAEEINAFIGRAMDSADYKEGAVAFAAKRLPRFVGH